MQNLRPVSARAAGDDEHAAVEGVGRADLEIVSLEVQCAEHVEEGGQPERQVVSSDAFVSTHGPDGRVFKRGYRRREEMSRRPEDVVVDEHRQGSLDVRKHMGYLFAFVSLHRARDFDVSAGVSGDKGANDPTRLTVKLRANSDDVDRRWAVHEHRRETFLEIVVCRLNCGDNDSHVALSDCPDGWDRRVLVTPERNNVDDQAEVSKDEEGNEGAVGMAEDCCSGADKQRSQILIHVDGR